MAKQASANQENEASEQQVEHRASVRYSWGGKSPCKSLAGWRGDSWEAVVRDISQSGLGLLVSRRFEPGAILAVELPRTGEATPHLVLARVVRVSPHGEGHWLVGCRMVHPLSRDEVRTLL